MSIKKIASSLVASSAMALVFAANAENKPVVYPKNVPKADISFAMLSNKQVDFNLQIPTYEAYGFTGKAKTENDKKKVEEVVNNVNANFSNLIKPIDANINCTYKAVNVNSFKRMKEIETYGRAKDSKLVTSNVKFDVLEISGTMFCDTVLKDKQVVLNMPVVNEVEKILVNLKGSKNENFLLDTKNTIFTL